jgi:hypothetical protein
VSRFAFWMINIAGLFLIINRDPDDTSQSRMILAYTLVTIGTGGILFNMILNLRRAHKATQRDTEQEEQL